MAQKGTIRKSIKDLQRIKTWQLLLLFILLCFVAATFLRLNNIGMVQRREAVLNADAAGNEEAIIERLYDLQRHVSSHMNTSLGQGVYLENSYNTALQNWIEKQYGTANPNGNIYNQADAVCAPQFSSYSYAYLQCITNELEKFPAADAPANDSSRPRQEAYIFNYASPLWSPDFAGWSILACVLVLVLIIVRLVSLAVLQLLLKRHYKRI